MTTAKIANAAVGDAQLGTALSASKIAAGSVSNSEFEALDGVTGALQTQLDARVRKIGDTLSGSLVLDVAPLAPATTDAVRIKSSQQLRFENAESTPNAITIRAPSAAFTNQDYVWPTTPPGANQVLRSDVSGQLSWWTPGNSVTSLGQIMCRPRSIVTKLVNS